MDLSIVILSYNTRQLLENCLRSVWANIDGIDTEVFIVDSGSTDGSVEMLRKDYPNANLMLTPEFKGFSHANNLALRRAQGRFQLLINSDIELSVQSLKRAIDFMEAHPEVGMMGPRLNLENGKLDLACRRSFPTPEVAFYRLSGLSKLLPRSRRFGRYNMTFLEPSQSTEVDSICGAFALVRREAVEQAGLLDETFYFYGEDLDWAMRFKQKGWKVYYNADIQILHHKGQTSRQQSTRLIREFYRAMRLFYDKHYAATNSQLTRAVIFTGIWLGEQWSLLKNRLRPAEKRRVAT